MSVIVKKMETDDEIRGKAYVHRQSWQEAYAGIVDPAYLEKLTPEKCEAMAFRWRDNVLVAKEGDRVIGFAGYGACRDEDAKDAGTVFAIYILAEYYGQGVGYRLMQAALEELCDYPRVAVWVLADNARAIRFYRRCGFLPDGREQTVHLGTDLTEIRMMLTR